MPTKETVTAQDFFNEAVDVIDDGYEGKELASWCIIKFEKLLSKALQQAFQEGRKQGLKEMDEALTGGIGGSPLVTDDEIANMRAEYQDLTK